MSKGFLWFCQNNDNTDYVELSIGLAKSLKKHNLHNNVCVITDEKTKINNNNIDKVIVMHDDDSKDHKVKWGNEYKAFSMSPFTHTIKLAADMLWNTNTDWWWYYLWQHNMVFSIDCFNYKNELVKDKSYRHFHSRNFLPNIYSDLTYFRKSQQSVLFGKICQNLTKNWSEVRDQMLIDCHDEYPSTDVIYALAYRLTDPTNENLIDYPWFKMIHNKKAINSLEHTADMQKYLMPVRIDDRIIQGGYAQTRPLHYVNKKVLEEINARIF